jgi:Lipid A 3-O-deacylase (PagL)
MVFPFKSHWLWRAGKALCCVLGLSAGVGRAQEFRIESSGARFGFGGNESSSDFLQSEAFVDWELPWRWDLGKEWHLHSRLDLSFGWLGETGAHGLDGVIGTAGPIFVLGHGSLPLFLEGGVSPTGLSRYDYESKDLGLRFQFTTHIGIEYDITSHLRANFRYQHMSNADISGHNPGLNLFMFGLSCVF